MLIIIFSHLFYKIVYTIGQCRIKYVYIHIEVNLTQNFIYCWLMSYKIIYTIR